MTSKKLVLFMLLVLGMPGFAMADDEGRDRPSAASIHFAGGGNFVPTEPRICGQHVEYDAYTDQVITSSTGVNGSGCSEMGTVRIYQCYSNSSTCNQVDGYSTCSGSTNWASLRVLSDGNFLLKHEGCSDTKYVRR